MEHSKETQGELFNIKREVDSMDDFEHLEHDSSPLQDLLGLKPDKEVTAPETFHEINNTPKNTVSHQTGATDLLTSLEKPLIPENMNRNLLEDDFLDREQNKETLDQVLHDPSLKTSSILDHGDNKLSSANLIEAEKISEPQKKEVDQFLDFEQDISEPIHVSENVKQQAFEDTFKPEPILTAPLIHTQEPEISLTQPSISPILEPIKAHEPEKIVSTATAPNTEKKTEGPEKTAKKLVEDKSSLVTPVPAKIAPTDAAAIFCQMGLELGPQPIWNATYTDKLRHDLLLNYDKFSRPAQHYNATTVRFGIVIRHIEFNEFKSTLTVYAWLRMKWNDEKLKWDPSNYGNLSILHLAEHELWQPDIYLYNSATGTAVNQFGNTHFLVYPDGKVLWVPPTQLTVLCGLDLKNWPFDRQECYMKFGSWTYSGDQIELLNIDDNHNVEVEMIINNSEWEITKVSQSRNEKYYSCCTEAYPDITVNMTLTRISTSYKSIIITPAFVVIVLTILSFCLPPQAGEKVILNACTAVIACLFTLYFTQKLPLMGAETPLIVMFYTSSLYVVTFSMIGSIVVITISRTQHSTSLPWIIKQPLTGKFGKLLRLDNYMHQTITQSHGITAEEMREHQGSDFDDGNSEDNHIIKSQLPPNKQSLQRDWILLAAAIDRISFVFYCLLFMILSIVYSL